MRRIERPSVADAVISPVGGVQPARARNSPNEFRPPSDTNVATRPDAAPNDAADEPRQTPKSRQLVTGQIDIDAATGRWIIQAISEKSDAAVTPAPSEVELRIREYADSGSADEPHLISRKV